MTDLVKTGLGGSRMQKEADKNLYFKPELFIAGDGVTFTLVDLITKEELEGVMQDAEGRIMYPQAAQTRTGLKISANIAGLDTFFVSETERGLLVSAMASVYATNTHLTTVSGDLVAQLPSLSGYATQAWTTGQLSTTVSGYSGTVTVSGAQFTILHGLITHVA